MTLTTRLSTNRFTLTLTLVVVLLTLVSLAVQSVDVLLSGGVENLTVLQNVARTVALPHVEELLEMLGVVVFVHALLLKAGSGFERYEFVLETASRPSPSAEGASSGGAAQTRRRG